jgi:hypothetical protein
MIERMSTKKGETALKWNGRWICSSIDASREGEQWLEKNSKKLCGHDHVFVLGVGCASHLAVLRKAYPQMKIVAIDTNAEFIEFARADKSIDLAEIQFIHAEDKKSFKNSSVLKKILPKEYAVVKFAPALITNENLYAEIESLLLAREEEGFQFILNLRPDLKETLSHEPVREVSNHLISIKTLEKMLNPNSESQQHLLLRALRELVN